MENYRKVGNYILKDWMDLLISCYLRQVYGSL